MTEEYLDIFEKYGYNISVKKDEKKILSLSWKKMYELAKVYYEHYGNLEIKKHIKQKTVMKKIVKAII